MGYNLRLDKQYHKGKLMKTRLSTIMMVLSATLSMTALVGCDNSHNSDNIDNADSVKNTDNTDTVNSANTATDSSDTGQSTPTEPTTATADSVDWSIVASGEQPADRKNYAYPFTIDSQNVRDYAEYFDVDNATAQHNLTVSMASNEALSKVLDQLSTSYTSHQLTDGENIKLIVHTTPEVQASQYDYVFSEDFAKGLVLPIEIKPDGVKGDE